jgi:hypothetical protein
MSSLLHGAGGGSHPFGAPAPSPPLAGTEQQQQQQATAGQHNPAPQLTPAPQQPGGYLQPLVNTRVLTTKRQQGVYNMAAVEQELVSSQKIPGAWERNLAQPLRHYIDSRHFNPHGELARIANTITSRCVVDGVEYTMYWYLARTQPGGRHNFHSDGGGPWGELPA